MEKVPALVKSGLIISLHKRLPFCKVKIYLKTSNRLNNYFSFKGVVPEPLRSSQIYNFTWESCNASHIGKTCRHFKIRVSEHQGVSPRTGKHLKGTFSTSLRDHLLDCNHVVAWDDFKVLGRKLIIGSWRLSCFSCFCKVVILDICYKISIVFICGYWIRCLYI